MWDLLKKNLYLTVGLASMTGAKVRELGQKLAEESKVSREEGEKFVSELMKHADESKANIEKHFAEAAEKTMSKLKLPCHTGFCKIEAELKQLRETVERLEKKIKD
jgi:polyhydroxyalkanoate synthesis regulator phasin